jgi:hypothetical protein
MKGGNLQRKNNMASLGNKANMKANILDMPQKATQSVEAKIMKTRGISNR